MLKESDCWLPVHPLHACLHPQNASPKWCPHCLIYEAQFHITFSRSAIQTLILPSPRTWSLESLNLFCRSSWSPQSPLHSSSKAARADLHAPKITTLLAPENSCSSMLPPVRCWSPWFRPQQQIKQKKDTLWSRYIIVVVSHHIQIRPVIFAFDISNLGYVSVYASFLDKPILLWPLVLFQHEKWTSHPAILGKLLTTERHKWIWRVSQPFRHSHFISLHILEFEQSETLQAQTTLH